MNAPFARGSRTPPDRRLNILNIATRQENSTKEAWLTIATCDPKMSGHTVAMIGALFGTNATSAISNPKCKNGQDDAENCQFANH
jgi:hypothetical protein